MLIHPLQCETSNREVKILVWFGQTFVLVSIRKPEKLRYKGINNIIYKENKVMRTSSNKSKNRSEKQDYEGPLCVDILVHVFQKTFGC